MAIPFDRAVKVGYRSSAIVLSCLRTKGPIVREWRREIRAEVEALPKGPPKRKRSEFLLMWMNMANTMLEGREFFNRGVEGFGSVKDYIEGLWVDDMGNNINNLDDWATYSNLTLRTPISFNSDPRLVTEVNDAEAAFLLSGSDSTTDWEYNASLTGAQRTTAFISMFDSLVDNLWKAESMRRWVNNQANRSQATPAALVTWDFIHDKCAQYFDHSMRCLMKIDQQIYVRRNDTPPDSTRANSLPDKYDYKPATSIDAVGGLYALDVSTLTTTWQNNAQTSAVVYNDAGT